MRQVLLVLHILYTCGRIINLLIAKHSYETTYAAGAEYFAWRLVQMSSIYVRT